MGTDRMKHEENFEGRGKQGQQTPGRNPQDEQTAKRKEEPGSDPQRKYDKYEKDSEHRERGAGSVL